MPPQLARNHLQPRGHEPLPSIEGCGLNHRHPGMCKMDDRRTRPSPLQRDVGRYVLTRPGNWGAEKQGGPKEWEARPVHRKNADIHHPHRRCHDNLTTQRRNASEWTKTTIAATRAITGATTTAHRREANLNPATASTRRQRVEPRGRVNREEQEGRRGGG